MSADGASPGEAMISRASCSGAWSGPRSIESLERLDRLDARDAAERRERLHSSRAADAARDRSDRLAHLEAKDALLRAETLLHDLGTHHAQAHLVTAYADASKAEQTRLLQQISALDSSLGSGGLRAYISRGISLMKGSREGLTPLTGWTPSVAPGYSLDLGSADFEKYEGVGLSAVGRTAFVLVAGGLGERLGYSGIKLSLPAETLSATAGVSPSTGMCYLELYIRHILALGRLAADQAGGGLSAEGGLPLVIMTSDDTHAATAELLAANSNWGLPSSQLHLLKQEKVPCFADGSGALALEATDGLALLTKPHGHGDVHALLHSSGVASELLSRGVAHLVFFQDTNALIFNGLLAALGVSLAHSLDYNSICVPRKPGDASGGVMQLTRSRSATESEIESEIEVDPETSADPRRTKREILISIEYSELDALLQAATGAGDVAGADGLSPYPGNTNQLVVALAPYVSTLARTGGAVPEFVNPKYADKERTAFKKPTRLESMMQDLPWLLPSSANVSFTSLDAALFYAPVKNSLAEAAAKVAAGINPACASVGETAVYSFNAALLRLSGATLPPPPPPTRVAGVPLVLGPRVVLTPEFRPSVGIGLERIRGAKISLTPRSSLILDGEVRIESLELDGALRIRALRGARVTVRKLRVVNEGRPLVVLSEGELNDESVAEVAKLRGYKIQAGEQREIEFETPGDYVIDE